MFVIPNTRESSSNFDSFETVFSLKCRNPSSSLTASASTGSFVKVSIAFTVFSESALTAVTLAYPIQMLMVSVFVGTGVGLNSLISRRLGEGRQRDAELTATNGL
ncbi:MAG: hypothetical protein IKY02_06205, partial [Lachnospiraceae bacterium]|nr:hypothetical protein [Lachnospiraceae bacterium]